MGRYSMILVVTFALLVTGMKLNFSRIGSQAGRLSSGKYDALIARNVANSTAELCLLQLALDKNWRAGYSSLELNSATTNAFVYDSSQDSTLGQDTVRIDLVTTCNEAGSEVRVLVALNQTQWPAAVDAGITARANVKTLGNMVVDGRDHDWNGNLIAGSGTNAVSTSMHYIRGGNSQVGGTTGSGSDIAPAKTGYDDVVRELVTWEGGYPDTPDKVLGGAEAGYAEGTLKGIAESGLNGSQYVTDPSQLQLPLRGITYVELPDGGSWLPVDLGNESEGMLIVHNESCNAIMKNVNSGSFKGLIIADDVIHVHTEIVGAIFLLTAGPSEGNCIGNGSGSLIFSREAVNRAVESSGIGNVGLSVLEYWE